jgi:hypothetical protein
MPSLRARQVQRNDISSQIHYTQAKMQDFTHQASFLNRQIII